MNLDSSNQVVGQRITSHNNNTSSSNNSNNNGLRDSQQPLTQRHRRSLSASSRESREDPDLQSSWHSSSESTQLSQGQGLALGAVSGVGRQEHHHHHHRRQPQPTTLSPATHRAALSRAVAKTTTAPVGGGGLVLQSNDHQLNGGGRDFLLLGQQQGLMTPDLSRPRDPSLNPDFNKSAAVTGGSNTYTSINNNNNNNNSLKLGEGHPSNTTLSSFEFDESRRSPSSSSGWGDVQQQQQHEQSRQQESQYSPNTSRHGGGNSNAISSSNDIWSSSSPFRPSSMDDEPLNLGADNAVDNHSASSSSWYNPGIDQNSSSLGSIGKSQSQTRGGGGGGGGTEIGSSSLFRPSSQPVSSSLVHGTFDYHGTEGYNNSNNKNLRQQQEHHHSVTDSVASSMYSMNLRGRDHEQPSSGYPSYGSKPETSGAMTGKRDTDLMSRGTGWNPSAAGDGGSLPGVVGASSGSTIGGVSSTSTTTMGHNPWEYGSSQPKSGISKSDMVFSQNSSRYFPTQELHQGRDLQKPPSGYNRSSYRGHDQNYPQDAPNWQHSKDIDSASMLSYNTNKSYDDMSRYTHSTQDGDSYGQDSYSYDRQQQQQQQQRTRNTKNTGRGGGRGQGRGRGSGRDSSRHSSFVKEDQSFASSKASSEAVRMLMNPAGPSTSASWASSNTSALQGSRLPLDNLNEPEDAYSSVSRPILPSMDDLVLADEENTDEDFTEDSQLWGADSTTGDMSASGPAKKREWLLRMNRRLTEIPIGVLDPTHTPIAAIMNGWAKTKSAQGASHVEAWLKRAQQEYDAGNTRIVPTNKMFTMAVDAWAKSNEGVSAAQRAEAILQYMHEQFQKTGLDSLRPTTGIFNAVINAWARSNDKMAPSRAEQILTWMDNLHKSHPSIQADKYSYNTVIHSFSRSGGPGAAKKAQELLSTMQRKYEEGNKSTKPDTITYNVVINGMAKSGGKGAAAGAEKLLAKMHQLHEDGDPDVKPNVISYGAVIDSYAKSGEKGAASRADALLARMIQLHQMDPIGNADLAPNTYVFNTVINCHSKSREHDAPSKAEEMLQAMNRLHASGIANIKPDAFTYTAVIDAWAKSGHRGAATRADQLLDTMESKYLAGEVDLRPNTFTYNAVIQALAKSGEPGAAAKAERVLHNMVNRRRHGASNDVKPTTINFNSVLDAYAKSGGGRKAAERAEEILQWMDSLYNAGGNDDIKPDTITFNAVIDAWARSGDRMAAQRSEQILDHMDELYRAGNYGVKPDVYTYNTLINCHSKSKEKGSAARAEHVLQVMRQRYMDGDKDFKPNTRSHTSVIDAIAKSGEKHAARRAEHILNTMITSYEETKDLDIKPNVHTANAVCNACAFTKVIEDRSEALQIAFRVFDWLSSQKDMEPDSYTFTILLSVCANIIPINDPQARFSHSKAFFDKCCETGYVNDYVLRKLHHAVTEEEYSILLSQGGISSIAGTSHNFVSSTVMRQLPSSWTRKVSRPHQSRNTNNSKRNNPGRGGGGRGSSHHRGRRGRGGR
eukprot:CAMPEP_0113488838 /NCGR_PEP_ID=MMETSP0014_2-20120614/26223_1 /TAXON_ID=2857 /ORGANISM="Nitzschia sp." /LENGTH=1510 /DNA_ID=CAMNT_0000382563 /DNA_START=209 /DNA_END=4741 /DNA_ORIENTATION=+ /assembly_acc=CAM_ASM_000159